MKVAGASSLKELFISTHRDAERVNHLVPMMLRCGDDVVVVSVEILDFSLKVRGRCFQFLKRRDLRVIPDPQRFDPCDCNFIYT